MNHALPIQLLFHTHESLQHFQFSPSTDSLLVLVRSLPSGSFSQPIAPDQILLKWELIGSQVQIEALVFLAAGDSFDQETLRIELLRLRDNDTDKPITLLVPYQVPPLYNARCDGAVGSALIPYVHFDKSCLQYAGDFQLLIYHVVYNYLCRPASRNIQVCQVGKPAKVAVENAQNNTMEKKGFDLREAMLIIPHAGPVDLLERCFWHLNATRDLPEQINLCFDDTSYEHFDTDQLHHVHDRLVRYQNSPLRIGPYPPRHYAIVQSNHKYVFFLDSDDIATADRFAVQLRELNERGLDMIGCHELQVNQLDSQIILNRFPLEVDLGAEESVELKAFHPLFHPTALVTREAYLKTKGFSTNLRFGYDSQFLLRAHFFMRIGNVDDFLYIRFKRPESLTTSATTKLGSNFRSFLAWRWMVDFELVVRGHLDLEDSSLSVQKHSFDYELQRI